MGMTQWNWHNGRKQSRNALTRLTGSVRVGFF
jgi:hypothetical protein